MSSHLDAVTLSNDTSWRWNVLPLLALAVVLCALFVPPAQDAELAAAEAGEAVPLAMLVVPAPQPGEGEPGPRTEGLRQAY